MYPRKRCAAPEIIRNILLVLTLPLAVMVRADALSLAEAERLALSQDPMALAYGQRHDAYAYRADAADAWPDPQLRFGVVNLPIDGLSISQQPMTQSVIGLRQMMPRGGEVAAQRDANLGMGDAVLAEAADRRAMLRRQVRDLWAELAYQASTRRVLEESRDLFVGLVEISRANYAVGGRGRQAVLRAELELERLAEREMRVDQRDDELRAALAGLIGEAAGGELALDMPERTRTDSGSLDAHPRVRMLDARLRAASADVAAADARGGPRWSFDVAYGMRAGSDVAGGSRSDFLSAMVSMDMPLFSDRRQRGDLDAAGAQQQALVAERAELMRRLLAEVRSQESTLGRIGERETQFETLIRIGTQRAEATLDAYRRDTADFDEVMRAHIALLELRIERERLRADRALATDALAYLMDPTGGDDDV